MKQLSGLDASFLFMETPEMPMHVGGLNVFELPAGYRGRFVHDLRRHLAARLSLAPPLRQKLAWMPFNLANPVWIDAVPALEHHVEPVKLPKGSDMAALHAKVGELHPLLLERDRPLWKFYVFEGLAPGPGGRKRVGLYTKVHHAAVDGQAAVALAAAVFDVSPQPRDIARQPQPQRKLHIGMAEMLSGVFVNQLQQYVGIVKRLPSTVGALSEVAKQGAGGVGSAALARVRRGSRAGEDAVTLGLAPRTRLNVSVSDRRAFASASLPMAEVKALRRAHEVTVNDVVLMVAGGALRRWFAVHGAVPRKSLVAAVPVSTRAAGDTSSNNQASMTLVKLGTHIADPVKRLRYVKAATAAMKATLGSVKTLMPMDFPSFGVPWLMSAMTSVYGRAKVADRVPPIANVAISNVPGPAFPLYIAGAKMLANYPTSIVVHGIALNITVQSYDASLDFGMMACGKAMPDVAGFARCLLESFEELKALPVTAAAPPPATVAPGTPGAAKNKRSTAKPAARVPKATRSPRANAAS